MGREPVRDVKGSRQGTKDEYCGAGVATRTAASVPGDSLKARSDAEGTLRPWRAGDWYRGAPDSPRPTMNACGRESDGPARAMASLRSRVCGISETLRT